MYYNRRTLALSIAVSAVCATLIVHDTYPRRCQINLITAIENGDTAGVQRALAWGADPNGVTNSATESIASPGQTATTFAVLEGSTQIVEELIDGGGFVNGADPSHRTPLIAAICTHNIAMCSMLLRKGADPNKLGANPFHTLILESPMDAVANKVVTVRPGFSFAIAIPQSKNEVLALYKLLRTKGAVPTLAQAIDVGDTGEAKALIADQKISEHSEPTYEPELFADAIPLVKNHNLGLVGSDSRQILRLDVGI